MRGARATGLFLFAAMNVEMGAHRNGLGLGLNPNFPLCRVAFLTDACGRNVESADNWSGSLLSGALLLLGTDSPGLFLRRR